MNPKFVELSDRVFVTRDAYESAKAAEYRAMHPGQPDYERYAHAQLVRESFEVYVESLEAYHNATCETFEAADTIPNIKVAS